MLSSSESAESERMVDVIERFRCMPEMSKLQLPMNTQEAVMENYYRSIFGELEERIEDRHDEEAKLQPLNNSWNKNSMQDESIKELSLEPIGEIVLAMTQSMKERSSSKRE